MRGSEGVGEHEREAINSRWGNRELLSTGLQNCMERGGKEGLQRKLSCSF